ncbi:MAG: 2Fe-2S iron-sulfur cluster-binding protein [Ramlibacter sp.]
MAAGRPAPPERTLRNRGNRRASRPDKRRQDGDILTVERFGSVGALHLLQAEFVEHDAFQCGHCTPGEFRPFLAAHLWLAERLLGASRCPGHYLAQPAVSRVVLVSAMPNRAND